MRAQSSLLLLGFAACATLTPASGVTVREPAAGSPARASPGALPQPELRAPPPPWSWNGPPPDHRHTGATVARDGLVCSFAYADRGPVAHLACSSAGRELWHRDELGALDDAAALLLDTGTLYVARHSSISDGCTLHAIDAQTGAERWKTRLRALGPVAHSEYLNAVEVRMDRGRVVVFGWESAGRYIEGVDPATGATRFHVEVKSP